MSDAAAEVAHRFAATCAACVFGLDRGVFGDAANRHSKTCDDLAAAIDTELAWEAALKDTARTKAIDIAARLTTAEGLLLRCADLVPTTPLGAEVYAFLTPPSTSTPTDPDDKP